MHLCFLQVLQLPVGEQLDGAHTLPPPTLPRLDLNAPLLAKQCLLMLALALLLHTSSSILHPQTHTLQVRFPRSGPQSCLIRWLSISLFILDRCLPGVIVVPSAHPKC